jgi:integrase
MLTVENARQGLLGRADFEALRQAITDPDLRDYLEFFWWTGMRPGEIAKLTWAMFDSDAWTLTLAAHAAKTRRARTLAIVGPLRSILARRRAARRLDCPLIFHRVVKGQVAQPIKDYRKAWSGALAGAKLPAGLVPYDLRRSALRNLVRSGVDVTVAMKISGHRTRSTFDRYNIVDTEDVAQALELVEAYVGAQPAKRKVAAFEHAQNAHTQRPKAKAR